MVSIEWITKTIIGKRLQCRGIAIVVAELVGFSCGSDRRSAQHLSAATNVVWANLWCA